MKAPEQLVLEPNVNMAHNASLHLHDKEEKA